jgi:XTP/dITP diphosphohydrolase
MRLLVATRSAHKLHEIEQILGPGSGVELVDLDAAGIRERPEEAEVEAFDTFEENALAKARYFAALADLPVLADDSGLCVDALGGAPGVRSKRFAGVAGPNADASNNRRLLELLSGVADERRSAHYVCVMALVEPAGERLFRGECHGRILREPRGEGGFGYDPLFFHPGLDASFAEVPTSEKNRISHRAVALEHTASYLRELSL